MKIRLRDNRGQMHELPDNVTVEIVDGDRLAGVVLPTDHGVTVLTPDDKDFETYTRAVGATKAEVVNHRRT